MNRPRVAALVVAAICLVSPVAAHTPVEGIGRLYGGMLHPLLVPSHLLLLLGLGLWIGQQGLSHIESALPAFAVGLAFGLVGAGLGYSASLPSPLFLFFATLLGLWVTTARPLPRECLAVGAIAAGLLVGLDSVPEAGARRELLMTLFGTALGAGFVVVHVVALVELFQRPWQRIGVRIIASWICAASIMVLALAFAPDRDPSASRPRPAAPSLLDDPSNGADSEKPPRPARIKTEEPSQADPAMDGSHRIYPARPGGIK